MLNKYRKTLSRFLNAIGTKLVAIGLRAWHLTLLGLLITILAGTILLLYPHNIGIIASGTLYILAGFMDSLDGTVARLRDEVSAWGGFIDAYLDRVEEAVYLIFLIPSVLQPDPVYITAFLALSFLISYSRAKASEFNIKLSGIGLMERAERMIILGLGVILIPWIYDINIILIILIILCLYTVLERVYKIYKAASSIHSKN